MSKIAATAGGTKTPIPDGTYPVTVIGVKDEELENAQFGTGEVVRLQLQVSGVFNEDGDEAEIDTIANRRLTPKSKLWGWFLAFGMRPEIGVEMDTDDLLGKSALARIENQKKDDGSEWPRVADIFPTLTTAPATNGTMDTTRFWSIAYSMGERDVIFSKVKALTGGRMLAGMDAAQLESLLAKLQGAQKGKCKHGDAAYTEAGEFICRDCGLSGPALEKELTPTPA